MRAITGRAVDRGVTQAEKELASAHRIIHVLLTRECGGSAEISYAELNAVPRPWLTTQLADGGLIVRAR
jgi:hypothetical protein